MKLKAYLKTFGVTGVEFAKLIGVEPSAVSNYIQGIRRPKPEIATKIVRESRGQVSYADLYAEVDA